MEVGIKRISPNTIDRIYNGRKLGAEVFFGLCTIEGLVFALYPVQNFSLYEKLFAIILTVLISILVASLGGRQKLLPYTFIDELSSENSYSATFCTNNGLREADEMTKPYFGNEFIPVDKIEQWRLKNDKGFVQINNPEGVLCACFVILGLEGSFFNQFIAGKVTENDIDSNTVLPFNKVKKEKRIYISGVVVREPESYMGSKRTKAMLWAIIQYINRVLGLRKSRTFYAVGLTTPSEKLLKNIGFKICSNKTNRKDKHNLYDITLDKRKLEELHAKIGNFSKMVSLDKLKIYKK